MKLRAQQFYCRFTLGVRLQGQRGAKPGCGEAAGAVPAALRSARARGAAADGARAAVREAGVPRTQERQDHGEAAELQPASCHPWL